jgi:hypothetical protein
VTYCERYRERGEGRSTADYGADHHGHAQGFHLAPKSFIT